MKKLILLSLSILGCHSTPAKLSQSNQSPLPVIQTEVTLETVEGFNFKWGGFSGLYLIQQEPNGDLLFWTLTDRGPNGAEFKRDKKRFRAFLSPNFTPSFVQLKFIKAENKVVVVKTIPFKNLANKPMTGLPPKEAVAKTEFATNDEGTEIESDNNGVDSESMTIDGQKHFWVGDEYLPSLLEFNESGRLQARISPAKEAGPVLKKNEIPSAYNFRHFNRGFEAIGYKNNKIFFMSQSPLRVKDAIKDKNFSVIRIGVFNTKTRIYEAEYLYPLTLKNVDKIGDLVMIDDNQFYVIEQNGDVGPDSVHHIYKVNLSSATNLVKTPLPRDPETYEKSELNSLVKTAEKTLAADLVKRGYSDYEKIEGLTIINDKTLAIINDNDFGVFTTSTGKTEVIYRKTVLGFITL